MGPRGLEPTPPPARVHHDAAASPRIPFPARTAWGPSVRGCPCSHWVTAVSGLESHWCREGGWAGPGPRGRVGLPQGEPPYKPPSSCAAVPGAGVRRGRPNVASGVSALTSPLFTNTAAQKTRPRRELSLRLREFNRSKESRRVFSRQRGLKPSPGLSQSAGGTDAGESTRLRGLLPGGMLISKLNSLAHISSDMPAKIQLQVHPG